MKNNGELKQIEKLLDCFKEMNFVEILGFGRLVGIEEKDEFEEYMQDLCVAYSEQPRTERRRLLKLAKQVISGR